MKGIIEMIKAAIFDLDGTLLDSMSMWESLGEDYLRTLGKEPTDGLAETVKTLTLRQSAEYFKSRYNLKLSEDDIIKALTAMIKELYLSRAELKSGMREILESMYRKGVKMCVATATDKTLAEAAIERLGIGKFFVGVITCDEIGYGKSSPRIYQAALDMLGSSKEQTAVLEDALYALVTAKKDGFRTVGVYDAYEKNQAEMKNEADAYIESGDSADEAISKIEIL